MAFCKKCGSELHDGATFCDRCGQSVLSGPQPFDSFSQPSYKSGAMNPSDRKLLRVLSVIFAVALTIFFVGLGGRIYIGRVLDCPDNHFSYDSEYRSYAIRKMAALARSDARGYLNADLDLAKKENPDASWIQNYKISDDEVEDTQTIFKEDHEKGRDKYGVRWILFQLAGYYSPLMWVFGIAAVISLALWLVKGGRLSNMGSTVSPAACIIVLGLIFLGVYCFLSPNFSDLE